MCYFFFFIEFSLRPFQCSVFFYCGLFRVGEGGGGGILSMVVVLCCYFMAMTLVRILL